MDKDVFDGTEVEMLAYRNYALKVDLEMRSLKHETLKK